MAYIPISHESHKSKHWLRHTSMLFARGDAVTPIFVDELSAVLQSMPIAFIKQDGRFVLVGVMGLVPGKNLFVSSIGEWLSDYLPAAYRCSPFKLMVTTNNEKEKILCIAENCVTDGPEGEPFFTAEGDATESIINSFQMVQKLTAHQLLTERACADLTEYNLIEPWEITIDNDGEKTPVKGLFKINETNLNNLSGESFLKLRNSQAITTAYAQLFSTKKLSHLASLFRTSHTLESKSSLNETFNFSGL